MKLRMILLLSFLMTTSPAYAFTFASVIELFQSMQREMSAWAITTKQTSVAANQITDTNKASNQQLATAIGAISMSGRIRDTIGGFSGALGQPESNRCESQQDNNAFERAIRAQKTDQVARMSTFVNTRAASIVEDAQQKIGAHQDFCSVSEAKQGMCKLKSNGMQSWDSNYAGFSSEQSLSIESEVGALNYVAMTTNNTPVAGSDCKSEACKNARAQQLALSAVTSMSTNAFVHQVSMRIKPAVEK